MSVPEGVPLAPDAKGAPSGAGKVGRGNSGKKKFFFIEFQGSFN